MIWPPSILRYRRARPGKMAIGVWIPLLIVWPVATVCYLVLLPLLGLLALCLIQTRLAKPILLGWPAILIVLCVARGLRVEIRDDEKELLFYVV